MFLQPVEGAAPMCSRRGRDFGASSGWAARCVPNTSAFNRALLGGTLAIFGDVAAIICFNAGVLHITPS